MAMVKGKLWIRECLPLASKPQRRLVVVPAIRGVSPSRTAKQVGGMLINLHIKKRPVSLLVESKTGRIFVLICKMVFAVSLLRRNPSLLKHIHAVIFRDDHLGDVFLLAAVEAVPDLAPVTAGAGFAVFGRAGFEEVGVLDTVQQWREPWQRVVFDHVDRIEAQLAKAPVGDVADVALDFLGGHAGDGAHFEGEIDEIVFQTDNLLAAIDDVFPDRLGQAATLRAECVEQLGDAFAV